MFRVIILDDRQIIYCKQPDIRAFTYCAAAVRTRDQLLLKLRSHDARRVRTFSFVCTGIESVNPDFPGAETLLRARASSR